MVAAEVMLDLHKAFDLVDRGLLLQAAAAGTASHVVRPAWNDTVLIKRTLDIGAHVPEY